MEEEFECMVDAISTRCEVYGRVKVTATCIYNAMEVLWISF